ncbi:MAG: response regulator, partial [Novosphingobium sp.]
MKRSCPAAITGGWNDMVLEMNELATVLLTNDRADLAAAIAASFPGMPVLECRSLPPRQRIDGRLWCFVDWLLEDTSGLEMCRRLRESPAASHGHITMVLDEDDSEIRRRAIRAGADDYL